MQYQLVKKLAVNLKESVNWYLEGVDENQRGKKVKSWSLKAKINLLNQHNLYNLKAFVLIPKDKLSLLPSPRNFTFMETIKKIPIKI